MTLTISNRDVLLVVDVQNDFLPGGSLAVGGGDVIIPIINALAHKFTNVVLTQDWHPSDHISFASNHYGEKPFESIDLPYGKQVLWPDHCIWDSEGAEFSAELEIPHAQTIIRKGYHRLVDSYSAFQEADRQTRTGLAAYLHERGIQKVYVVGLATDYCVSWTAIDAADNGFEVTVIEDATRAIDNNGSLAKAWADMAAASVKRVLSRDILG